MKGKKLIMFATAIALLVAIPAVVLAAVAQGNANTQPPTNIEADFKFLDNGTTLKITGKAKGLTPSKEYVSLIYGVNSLVTGLDACLPAPFFANMFVGVWNVGPNGKGSLSATNIASVIDGTVAYVPLTDIGTISVRLVTRNPALNPPASATDHRPTVVVTCGEVVED